MTKTFFRTGRKWTAINPSRHSYLKQLEITMARKLESSSQTTLKSVNGILPMIFSLKANIMLGQMEKF